ncbi:MAG: zinc metalloprotease [Tannerella sp.]|nr:zinc metalloprotease [Tannerella sp.]
MKRKNPERYQRFIDYEQLLQNQLLNSRTIPTGKIIIPVVVHVVYYNSSQNISDAQINAQIKVLNDDYQRLNADKNNTPTAFQSVAANMEIEFKLAKLDPSGYPTTGITRTSTSLNGFDMNSGNNVKFTASGGKDAWNTQKYLNLWVCNLNMYNGSELTGYGTFPQDLSTFPNLDGVVINYKYFGVGGHTVAPYNKGRTATHEVGHWLGLWHIWGKTNEQCSPCVDDDDVTDTPNQLCAKYGTLSGVQIDQCTTISPGIMYMNYMDYTDDAVMNIFTLGQKTRARAVFDDQTGIRRQMLTSAEVITNPPTISGLDLLCVGSSALYSAIYLPSGCTWSYSPNVTVVSSSANSITLTGKSTGSAFLNIISGSTVVAHKQFWVGPPVITGITYDGSYLILSTAGVNAALTQSQWIIGGNFYYGYPDRVAYPGGGGTVSVSVTADNNCGRSATYTTQISLMSRGSYQVFSPAGSHSVTVSFLQTETDKAALGTSLDRQTVKYTLISLTTGAGVASGTMPAAGGTLDFSHVPSGLYVFNIDKGDNQMESFKIVLN